MPFTRPSRGVLVASAGALLVSCGIPTDTCACPPATFDAVVYGTVTAADGSPVAGALVLAEAGRPGCEAQLHVLGDGTSGAGGGYRVVLRTPIEPRPGECLRVRALPPTGSTLDASEPLPFAVRFGVSRAIDSVRVELVLRPRQAGPLHEPGVCAVLHGIRAEVRPSRCLALVRPLTDSTCHP